MPGFPGGPAQEAGIPRLVAGAHRPPKQGQLWCGQGIEEGGRGPEAVLRLFGVEVRDDDDASCHLLPGFPVQSLSLPCPSLPT